MPGPIETVPATNGAALGAAVSPEERKQRLSTFVAEKVEQGYVVESQTDTEAVLSTVGRTRWFGLRGRMPGSRRRITVDEQGRPSTRKL